MVFQGLITLFSFYQVFEAINRYAGEPIAKTVLAISVARLM